MENPYEPLDCNDKLATRRSNSVVVLFSLCAALYIFLTYAVGLIGALKAPNFIAFVLLFPVMPFILTFGVAGIVVYLIGILILGWIVWRLLQKPWWPASFFIAISMGLVHGAISSYASWAFGG